MQNAVNIKYTPLLLLSLCDLTDQFKGRLLTQRFHLFITTSTVAFFLLYSCYVKQLHSINQFTSFSVELIRLIMAR